MFKIKQSYPQLQGTLTNITIGNLENFGDTALTRTKEFIINGESGNCPFVIKREIILGAAKFLKRDQMLKTCEEQVSIGHWPVNSNISSIVVHELGHHLLDVYTAEKFGFAGCYVTEENADAYWKYYSDSLKVNQTVPRGILQTAYEFWIKKCGHEGSLEDFQASISGYARGLQPDGGISYSETVAEAVADVYLNGEQAADASRLIVEILSADTSLPLNPLPNRTGSFFSNTISESTAKRFFTEILQIQCTCHVLVSGSPHQSWIILKKNITDPERSLQH